MKDGDKLVERLKQERGVMRDTDMNRQVKEHIEWSDKHYWLLGLRMLSGTFNEDFVFQQTLYLQALRYASVYPTYMGVN